MSIRDAIDAVAVMVESAPNVGHVHRFERLVKDWPAFIDKCRVPALGLARWWIVTRTARAAVLDAAGARRTHTIAVRGHQPLVDTSESERDFQDLADAVCDKFEPETRLTDRKRDRIAAGVFFDGAPTMTVDLRMIGGITCHYCEILIPAIERAGFCNV